MSKLKFAKHDPQRAEYVADAGDAIYRVARGPLGNWSVKVDGKEMASVIETKAEAIAYANELHELRRDVAANLGPKLRIVR